MLEVRQVYILERTLPVSRFNFPITHFVDHNYTLYTGYSHRDSFKNCRSQPSHFPDTMQDYEP